MVHVLKNEAVALLGRSAGVVVVKDSVHHSADRPRDRHRPVLRGDLLHEPARLEHARHHHQIRARVDQMRKLMVEPQLEMDVRMIIEVVFQMPEVTRDLSV